ncbi:MAG: Uridylate kinase [Gammaproteobacteria bacterium]|nr:Uridylate kinase [Gammaproteobacteria bacterium]
MPAAPVFRRVLLKLSGEALSGDQGFGIDTRTLDYVCREITSVAKLNVELAIVIGGGNFFRGVRAQESGIERAAADYMGMLATVINAIAMQQALQKAGIEARVQSAIPISPVSEPYVRERAIKHLHNGRVVIFASGTGNPYFTTDTAASLRAVETGADVLLKATQVDGIYTTDPKTDSDAARYHRISYSDALNNRIRIMDATAFALCREHNLPLRVFTMSRPGNFRGLVLGEDVGTLVSNEVNDD